MKTINITAYTDDASQIEIVATKDNSTYSEGFVHNILESRQEAKDGKTTRIKKEDLKAFLEL